MDNMYNDYFGFREKPFNVTPNPRYFYTNPIYREAYASLLYGIRERKGFIVLTGEIGTGKTTLLKLLMDNPDENIRLVFFYNTTLTFEELVSFACDELGLPVKGGERLQKIQALNEFLIAQSKKGGTVVLLVDEAQNLTDDVLENLRLLSNLETASEKLLQIVLVGQTELDAKLNQPQLRQIKQRVALYCRLDRLKDREVGPFVNYRLRMAGYEGEDLFTADAVRELASYSKGIPRVINIICDNALLIGYATSAKQISAGVIREVAEDLGIDSEKKVSTIELSTVKAAAKNRETEKEKRINVRRKEKIPRQRRNLRPMLMGSAGLLVLVMLIAGAMAYREAVESWIAVVTSSELDPANDQNADRPKSYNDSGLEDRSEEPADVDETVTSAPKEEAALTAEAQKNDQERAERPSAVPVQNSSETTKRLPRP
jgi:general secretion pathway protein A